MWVVRTTEIVCLAEMDALGVQLRVLPVSREFAHQCFKTPHPFRATDYSHLGASEAPSGLV